MQIIRSFFWFCSISVYKSQGENNSFRYLREKTLKSERPTSCDWHSNAKPWISPPRKRWKGKKERHLSEGNISNSTGTGTEEPAKKKDKIQAIQAFKKNGCVKVPVPFNPITNNLLRILRMPVMSLMMFHAAQWLQVEPGTRVTSKHNFWVTSKHSDLI